MRIMITGFLFKVMREYSSSSSSLEQFLDDISQKNMDQKAKKCSSSLTELPRNIIYFYTSVVSFSVHATLALGSSELNS